MLNVTDEELKQFEEWKKDFREELNIWMQTIRFVKPEDYQTDEFHMKLISIDSVIVGFSVKKEYAHFGNEKVESELAFGVALGELVRKIDAIVGDKYLDLFAERCGDLLIIFGI